MKELIYHPLLQSLFKVILGIGLGLGAAALILLIGRESPGMPVILRTPPTEPVWVVQVEGAVVHPGVYTLPQGSRLQDALQAAGGVLAEADLRSLNLARLLVDGERIDVPYKPGFALLVEMTPTPQNAPTTPAQTPGAAQTPTAVARIDINTATLEELQTLPGIGPVLAQRIIEYRETYGPFVDIEELLNVEGIGESLLERIRDLITVGE
jgi:competence protein ComEA